METALNVASVVFLGTLLFGFILAGYALYGFLARRRYLVPAPVADKLPTRALDAARHALDQLKAEYYRSSGAKHTRLGHEMQRLEMRIQHLLHRTNEDQFPFYQLSRKREKVWQDWKRAFDRQEFLYGHERKANLITVIQLVRQFREVDKLTQDERHRALARDELALQELQTQGVLQIAPPEPEQADQEAREAEAAAEHLKQVHAAHEHPAEAPPRAPDAVAEALPPQPAAPGQAPGAQAAPPMPTMHQSDFAYADLPKAGLRYADPEFSSALAPGGLLEGANLSGCSFAGVRFAGTQVFRNVNLAHADLRAIQLMRAEQPHQFVDCDFTGAHLGGARLEYALFLRCRFAYSHWPGARLNRVKFSDCDISGTRWDGIDLSRTVMSHEMLRQGDFSNAVQPPREPQPSPYDRPPGQPARPAPSQPSAQAPQPGQPAAQPVSSASAAPAATAQTPTPPAPSQGSAPPPAPPGQSGPSE